MPQGPLHRVLSPCRKGRGGTSCCKRLAGLRSKTSRKRIIPAFYGQPNRILRSLNPSSGGVLSLVLAAITTTLPTLFAELMSAHREALLVVLLSSRVPRLVKKASLNVLWLAIGLVFVPITLTCHCLQQCNQGTPYPLQSASRIQTTGSPGCRHVVHHVLIVETIPLAKFVLPTHDCTHRDKKYPGAVAVHPVERAYLHGHAAHRIGSDVTRGP